MGGEKPGRRHCRSRAAASRLTDYGREASEAVLASGPAAMRRNRREAVTAASGPADDAEAGTEAAAGAEAAGAEAAGAEAVEAGGVEPDARFTFANERTFLAWTRTALAFVVAGLAVVQLLPPFPGVPWGRRLLGVPLIMVGGVIAVVGYRQWSQNQQALRRGEPIAGSILPRVLAVAITAMAIVAAVILLLSAIQEG
jgi:putative membrane protein